MALFLMVSPLFTESWLFQVLAQLFVLNALLMALSASGSSAGQRSLWIVWGISLLASLAQFSPWRVELRARAGALEIAAAAVLIAACTTRILGFLFRSRQVTLDSIFASVVAYLLIAYVFGLVYTLLGLWQPESFELHTAAPAISAGALRYDMVYFSLVTIATLGYGDILPRTNPARMLATLEAVVGQFYVAVVVALLVARFVSPDSRPEAREDAGDARRQ